MYALMQKLLKQKPHQGVPLTTGQLTAHIRRIIGNKHTRVLTQKSQVVDPDMVCVGGFYDEGAEDNFEPCIDIVLYYHPSQQHIDVAKLDWERISFEIAETLGHEQIHREQKHRPRKNIRGYVSKGKSRAEKEYLGSDHEIEAYGFSIAAEMKYRVGIEDIDDFRMGEIPVWNEYQYLFSEDQSVLLKLRKHIIKYLRRLEVEHEQTNKNSGSGN